MTETIAGLEKIIHIHMAILREQAAEAAAAVAVGVVVEAGKNPVNKRWNRAGGGQWWRQRAKEEAGIEVVVAKANPKSEKSIRGRGKGATGRHGC